MEGAGKKYGAGQKVVVINNGTDDEPSWKFDVLAGFIDLSGYSTTEEMNTAISTAVAGKIALTDISASTTGEGNVISGASYNNTTGEFTYTKGVTALTEADFTAFTDAEIDGLWNGETE